MRKCVVSVEEALLWKEAYHTLRKVVQPKEGLKLDIFRVSGSDFFTLIVLYRDECEERFSSATAQAIEDIELLRYKGRDSSGKDALSTTTGALWQHNSKTLICITLIPTKIAEEITRTQGLVVGDLMIDLLSKLTDDILGSQEREFLPGGCWGLWAEIVLESGVLGEPGAKTTCKIVCKKPR